MSNKRSSMSWAFLLMVSLICISLSSQLKNVRRSSTIRSLSNKGSNTVQNLENSGSNICSRIESYPENYTFPYSYTKKESYTKWCFAIPPKCTAYRFKTVVENKTETVIRTRTVFECCEGYEKVNGSCVPACSLGCGHGECIEPDVCLCEEGWRAPLCISPCEPNRYGRGCMDKCTCLHGSTCDSKNGSCYCTEGYTGTFCELPCPDDLYGLDCKNMCQCQNGALCDIKDGTCDCQPGYTGEFCEEPCEDGKHGEDCEYDCLCLTEETESCSHIDGKCHCKPGYQGMHCGETCKNFTFGRDCENHCDCGNNTEYCDHEDGECFCNDGWTGKTCDEICPEGKFGPYCIFNCLTCPEGTGPCNPVTGHCNCPPRTSGITCDTLCPEGHWGFNCNQTCNCSDDEICNVTNGECTCLPGLMGPNCDETCPDGYGGTNCKRKCQCENAGTCDPIFGICACPAGWTGSKCTKACPEGSYGMNCAKTCKCGPKPKCDPKDGTCICVPGFYVDGCRDPDDSKYSPTSKAMYITIPLMIIFIGIIFAVCMVYCTYQRLRNFFKKSFPSSMKKWCCKKTNPDGLPDVTFANPIYVSPEALRVSIDGSEASGSSSTYLNPASNGNPNRLKKASAHIDLPAANRRQSKVNSVLGCLKDEKFDVSSINTDEDCEPEVLCNFNILDETFETIKISETDNATDKKF